MPITLSRALVGGGGGGYQIIMPLAFIVSGSLKLYGFGHCENVVFSSVFSLNIKKNLVVVGFYSIFFFLRDGVVGIVFIY